MNPVKFLTIDGKPEILQSFGVPEMSLSSSHATMVRHSFTFGINAVLIAEMLEPLYVALVDELKSDDDQCGKPQDALSNAGYPPFKDVLKTAELAETVLGHYLLDDWVGRFTSDRLEPTKYWFDRIDQCHIEGDQITLSGDCYE